MAAETWTRSRYTRQIHSLTEALVGLLLLIVLNWFAFPDDPGYLSVNPHPFLFLVILVASRYGTFDGFITGILAAAVYLGYVFWGRDLEAVRQTSDFALFLPAYLFVILGLLLGEIREAANRDVTTLGQEVRRLRAELEETRQRTQVLEKVKEELQQRVLASDDPLVRISETATRLATQTPDEACPAILDLVERFVMPEKFAIYLAVEAPGGVLGQPTPEAFELRLSRGWDRPDEFPHRLDGSHPAVQAALTRRQVASMASMDPDTTTDIVACAPIIEPHRDQVLALLVIERIPFLRLNQMTLNHLHTIAGWAGKTMGDARQLGDAQEARVDDPVSGVFHFRFLSRRLTEEAQRVRRYGGNCAYLVVHCPQFQELTPGDQRIFLRETGTLLKRLLRTMDVVGIHREPGFFGLILPSTTPHQALVVTARINEAFRKTFGGYGSRFDRLTIRMGLATTTASEPLSEARLMEYAERLDLREAH
ncbi:MAG TPA: hypothetical protein PLQ97_00750 [Myxococcota bacterium]|nr:hypothetical protein [Myxococcota bacterium]HQK49702.1 hypothetical protein [Myxococcota bacterium]